jgi:lysophospholipid acyltransferase (LPLAT)-like uncharacterized protein
VSSYRVDTAPLPVRWVLALYGYGLALLLLASWIADRRTLTVRIHHAERLVPGTSYIFCHWHETILLSFMSMVWPRAALWRGRQYVWMQHPFWYMKPVHALLYLLGVTKLVLGSTGHGGREVADELVRELENGHSTVILPDGPAGPPRVLKRGVLHIARQSRVAIVPLRLSVSRCVVLPTWDRKQMPLPFTKLEIRVGAPIQVGDRAIGDVEVELARALG